MKYLKICRLIVLLPILWMLAGIGALADSAPVSTSSTYFLDRISLQKIKKKALNGDSGAAIQVYQYFELSKFDTMQALPWLQLAACQENAVAQYNLGFMFAFEAPFKDMAAAKFWLNRAKANGSKLAENLLIEIGPQ